MDATPVQIAEQLLNGQTINRSLTASEFEDVVFYINRKLDGEEGYQLLISTKVQRSTYM